MAVTIELLDAEQATAFLEAMAQKGMDQVGKPLSVSIAGRTVSYGSAAEAFQGMLNLLKSQRELLELHVAQAPWTRNEVVRG